MLATALRVWFRQPRRADFRVIVRDGKGGHIEVDASRAHVDQLTEIVARRLAQVEDDLRHANLDKNTEFVARRPARPAEVAGDGLETSTDSPGKES
jgi:Effector Associated Constant Component 1